MVAQPTKRCAVLVFLLVLSATMLTALPATAQQFVTVDVPGATSTLVLGINNAGQTVGSYSDRQGVGHGFLLSNGTFTSITDPAFACCATYLSAITDTGVLVGSGINSNGNENGFEQVNGTFTTLDFPGANFTELLGIPFQNGAIVGAYSTSFPTGPFQGLTYYNGQFATFNVNGATNTVLYGISDGGQAVGSYSAPGVAHAFLTTCILQSGSEVCSQLGVTTADFPGAALTEPSNLNDSGQVVGAYVDSNNVTHGYLMTGGPFTYVANFNSNTVSVIDVQTSLAVSTIDVGTGPWGVAVTPNGQQAYVTNRTGNTVSVIDTTSNTVVNTIPVQSNPSGVAFTPDGSQAYVVDQGSNNVSVIDTASQTVVTNVQVGNGPVEVAMALTSNGTFAYVTNSLSNSVSVISTASDSVTSTVQVGMDPLGVAVTPNSSLVYVANAGSNTVSVLSVASNTVTATIPVGIGPSGVAFTPDSSLAYVVNDASNSVSVIATASNNVIATVTGLNGPTEVALTTDGSSAYVTNTAVNSVSVIVTATNTITGTVTVGSAPTGVATAAAPPQELIITQPLNPTQQNDFNFGTNAQAVQYPPGTNFSGVNMTTVAAQVSQASFAQRLANTQFASASCIVYSGNGGNCVDYEVSCTNTDMPPQPIPCPPASQPIAMQTSFTTLGGVVNPGYLTNPTGGNNWENIFTGFSDPTVRGKTKGFSLQPTPPTEFIAVSLGATNSQGLANFDLILPKEKIFQAGQDVPTEFKLTSVANGSPVTDAEASIVVEQIADGNGNPVSVFVLSKNNAFRQTHHPGVYGYRVITNNYAKGTYNITIFGNAFPAYQNQFKIVP